MRSKAVIFAILFACVSICLCLALGKVVIGFVIAFVPIFFLLLFKSFDNKLIAFLLLFIANYFVPVMEHYVYGFSFGLVMDMMIAFNLLVIASSYLTSKVNVKNVSKDVLVFIGIWMAYCIFEVLNPRMRDVKAWLSALRSMSLYFFLVFFIVQVIVNNVHQVKTILAVWSVLVLISVGKAIYQKFVGFTPGDMYFLNVMDGRRTHIIMYGIRYFSIFSDASNFGGSMGLATTVFAVAGLHDRNILKKLYWWIVALLACYGMFISGTRSALVVPAVGIVGYLFLVRDFKKAIPVLMALGAVICLLAFTSVGNANATIRRARTVFHPTQDRSYMIRKENRVELRTILKTMPMGNSLGMSAGRAHKYGDYSRLTDIPTDSWLVQLWVETGIIGLVIYLSLMGFIFVKGTILVFSRLKDPYVKGICAGLLAGVAGLLAMSTNSEVFSQFPNAVLVYTSLAIVFLGPALERNLEVKKDDIVHHSEL